MLSTENLQNEIPTRKKATCRWFLSEANCAGVNPVLSVIIKSSFFPAWTKTVHASKLPLMAAQWRGVQPIYTGESHHRLFQTKRNSKNSKQSDENYPLYLGDPYSHQEIEEGVYYQHNLYKQPFEHKQKYFA